MLLRKNLFCMLAAATVIACLLGLMAPSAFAGDSRGYKPLPDGATGVVAYYRHKSSNEFYADGKKVRDDINIEVDLTIIRPIHYRKIGGFMTSFQALLPYGRLSKDIPTAPTASASSSGLFDPTAIAGFWPVNNKETQTWLALAEWVCIPLGDYSQNHMSLGKNRWGFKTEAALIKGFGDFYVDVVPSYELFTENDEIKEEKDGIFRLETHLSYDFTKSFRLSLEHFYSKGGQTKLRGVKQNNEEDKQSLQVTMALRLAPKQQLLIQYMQDVAVENGPKYSQAGLRYMFLF